MRLEKQQEAELAERKGLAGKTVIQFIWLSISFVVAYFVARYIFDNGILKLSSFYSALNVSRAQVPPWAFLGLVMVIIVMIMQIILYMGFVFASPEGRRKTGKPSLHSRVKDPHDSEWSG